MRAGFRLLGSLLGGGAIGLWPQLGQMLDDAALITRITRSHGRRYRHYAVRRSKYMPHQSDREKARRRRQMAARDTVVSLSNAA